MWTSMTITSGRSCSACCTASSPSRATPMTSSAGSSLRRYTRYSRATAESSATSTRITGTPKLDESPNNLQQVCLVEAGFDQVRVGAHLDASLLVLSGFQRRDEHDRHVGHFLIRSNFCRQIQAVHPRHVHVRHDEIERLCLEQRPRFDAAHCRPHLVARRFEEVFLHRPRGDRIVHHEDEGLTFCLRSHGSKS